MENTPQEVVLEKILHCLQSMNHGNKKLWDAQGIAHYMGLNKRTVQNKVITDPTFPAPVILATGGKRWKAQEVEAWQGKRRSV